jgi:hypothetical protein
MWDNKLKIAPTLDVLSKPPLQINNIVVSIQVAFRRSKYCFAEKNEDGHEKNDHE